MTSIIPTSLPAKLQAAWEKQWTVDAPVLAALMTTFVSLCKVISFEELRSVKGKPYWHISKLKIETDKHAS